MRNPFAFQCGEFRVRYKDDLALYKVPRVRRRVLFVLGLFFLYPLLATPYYISLATMAAMAAIGAIGLNILTGYTGLISIGVGAFLGVGGYTSAIVTTHLGLPFWIAVPLAGLVTAFVGALFGVPSLRLKGLYLAMATLAAQVIILFVIVRWEGLTGGTAGMSLQRPDIFGYRLASERSYYYLVLVCLIGTALFTMNLFRTRVGRALVAIRDRDLAAEVMGINLFKYKIYAFAISSFFIGIAGALMGHYSRIIGPEHYDIEVSISYLAMILIGGLGSVIGAIFGAVFITLLPVVLRESLNLLTPILPHLAEHFSALRELVFGLMIILFLIYEPEGIVKMWRNLKDYLKLWPFSYSKK
ncbi:branched-chain amino acid ABC transporter permease [Caldalkalibacillus salinus]|uniref:branched-chain amino acid ABC transporter permease n=1 Tax=Caldalkalibacillus salinus TaxID=2803787 RepID=UPI0019212AA4|nr:branched-chain amino acid ABC transporter permease [Caldalkalibacillus salinus]